MKTQILIGILSLYLLLVIFFYFFQRSFLYFPQEDNYLTSEKINSKNEIFFIETLDKIKLKSYGFFDKKNTNTILFLHGNAGTLKNRIYKLNTFKELNLNYLAISWRGFSGNDGKPTEENLTIDALSGLNYLNKLGIDDNEIIVYGESLGTGVSINLVKLRKVKGLILESPFTSVAEVGKIKFPFLPVNLILKDKFESKKNIHQVKCPILVMHGFSDKIVPFYMGKNIFDSIEDEKYSFFTEDDHMMQYDFKMIKAIKNFISTLN